MKLSSQKIKLILSLLILFFGWTIEPLFARSKTKIVVFDTYHGQNPKNAETFNSLLPENSGSAVELNQAEISSATFQNVDAAIISFPTKPFSVAEKQAIEKFLNSGGSLLLIFDEERRTKLQEVGVNDFVLPFGIEFTGDAPVRHNCRAIAKKGKVCKAKRELPYSGGRSIKGGKVISRVYDEGNYIHCAWQKLPSGGKIILMSDGMAALLLGRPDGGRFSGTGPSDSKYWGKDSRVFMQEILSFLIK
jgi:hypothetical protein